MAEQSNATPNRPRQVEWRGYVQVAAILLTVAAVLYFAQAPDRVVRGTVSDGRMESARPTVSVLHPVAVDQTLAVELTGTVNLGEKATVVSEVVGRVAWVSPGFSNGGSIAANETFIKIEPAEFELRVEAAEMAVREAEARLWVERARAEEDVRAFERQNPGTEASESVRRLPWIAEAEARLMKAQADRKLADLDLDRTNISLPYDGRVMAADVEVGELVGPADLVGEGLSHLGTVYRLGALQVAVPIEPRDLEYLDPVVGRSARVVGQIGTWEARVARVSSVVAPKTRLASVFLKFVEDEHVDSLPAPGTFVEVDIEGPAYTGVYVLPESVVQERDSVWVVTDGLLSAFAPEGLGWTASGWVVQAFDAGEGVVVGTLPGARDGLAVSVRDADSAAN